MAVVTVIASLVFNAYILAKDYAFKVYRAGQRNALELVLKAVREKGEAMITMDGGETIFCSRDANAPLN